MQKKHSPDILVGKTGSSFIGVVDDGNPGSIDCFWNCLIQQTCILHPCLVVSADVITYRTCSPGQVTMLSTENFSNVDSLISHISQYAQEQAVKSARAPLYVFIDSFSWFLLHCPKQTEFEFWARRILAFLTELTSSESVGRVILLYRPVRNRQGTLIASSDSVLSLLDQTVTTLVRLQSPSVIKTNANSRVRQKMSLWHCRARQTSFTPAPSSDSTLRKNKPAFHECFTVEMDPVEWTFCQFTEITDVEPVTTAPSSESSQPESTFALTMTESEKIARSQVVLPYETVGINSGVAPDVGMTIHYQPDCFDDLDDEDPDDDLEI